MPLPMPMPGAGGPPGGGPPPGPMAAPPGGTGAATVPQGMQGGLGQAMAAIKAALDILNKAMPSLPMGSPIHTAVRKATDDLHKATEKQASDTAATVQLLSQLAREKSQGGQGAAFQRASQPPGPAMPMGGGGPPPPPMAA